MEKTKVNTEEPKEVQIPFESSGWAESSGEYGITHSSGTTAEKASKEIKTTSYPSPRAYDKEYLKSGAEAADIMPVYKEEIVRAYRERLKGKSLTAEQVKEIERKIIVIQEGKADAILSSLSSIYTGVTMDKVLRAIPEILYSQNRALGTLSDGKAHKALPPKAGTQLSLFVEIEENPMAYKNAAMVRYSAREWAKLIYAKSNPLPKEEEYIDKVVQQLSETKIYYPLGGGKYAYTPLIWRSHSGIFDARSADGTNFEYIMLHPLFTLALTESKRGILSDKEVTWHLPMRIVGKHLNTTLEYRLLTKLEVLYSHAKNDIKAAAAEGKRVYHRENKNTLLSVVSTASSASFKKNKARILKNLQTAFEKMEQLDIIAPDTFKEEKENYYWEWSPTYLSKR